MKARCGRPARRGQARLDWGQVPNFGMGWDGIQSAGSARSANTVSR